MKMRILIGLSFTFSACTLLEPQSSYKRGLEDEEYAAYSAQRSGSLQAYEELGLSPARRLTDDERDALDRRMKLIRMERNIASVATREQYFNYRPYLETDEEKIQFLSLPTKEARDRFAMNKGVYFKTNKHLPTVRDAVERGDIILGMTKDAVMESWGEPLAVEVAGNRQYGNEQWRYIEYISTPEGYQKEERVVIFESGKVVGWQRN